MKHLQILIIVFIVMMGFVACEDTTKAKAKACVTTATTLCIAKDVTTIEQNKYKNKGYTKVVFEQPSKLIQINRGAFADNKITSITLPDSLKMIDMEAFKGNKLTHVTIPSNVSHIGVKAFANNKIKDIVMNNEKLLIKGGMRYILRPSWEM